ncbi:hypothetical protein BU17DRAFT_64470 [Hysterangium stoloniferum]|nr:hypothetical protein BU17DRAFT_64470 [Hysterangium stoloniferum]
MVKTQVLFKHLSRQDNHRRDHGGHHLPDNASSLQIYNIKSACLACNLSPNKTTTPSAEELNILPLFSPGEDGTSGESTSLHDLPRWTNTTVRDDGGFDVTQAVRVAISDNNTSVIRPNAGAIAGGIIGGFVFISLVLIAFLVVRRRRLKAQIPPSAEFIAGAGPRATYNHASPDESFLPFEPDEWRDPVREKAYHAATAQREYREYDDGLSLASSRV